MEFGSMTKGKEFGVRFSQSASPSGARMPAKLLT